MNGSYTKAMLKSEKLYFKLSNNGIQGIMQKVCGEMGNDLLVEKKYLMI